MSHLHSNIDKQIDSDVSGEIIMNHFHLQVRSYLFTRSGSLYYEVHFTSYRELCT